METCTTLRKREDAYTERFNEHGDSHLGGFGLWPSGYLFRCIKIPGLCPGNSTHTFWNKFQSARP